MSPYLFTDRDCHFIEIATCAGGDAAKAHAQKLSRKYQKDVIVWCHVGGNNPYPNQIYA